MNGQNPLDKVFILVRLTETDGDVKVEQKTGTGILLMNPWERDSCGIIDGDLVKRPYKKFRSDMITRIK